MVRYVNRNEKRRTMNTLIQEMEEYAEELHIPIMQKEGIDFMCNFIQENQIRSVLEIGSAIGYSAIRMASLNEHITITTIERDEERFLKAQDNVRKANLQNRITLLYGDAFDVDITGTFDLLFIDAAKSQYTRFFERFEIYLEQGGYVITDNLKFHGLVEHPDSIQSRNLRQLVTKIGRFVAYLKERDDYDTVFYDFGDGVGISRKK